MGVYIKGMEMPKSCYDCSFAVEVYDGSGVCACVVTDKCVCRGAGRHDDCPLVPVPPHGRLIDADALIDKVIAKYLKFEREGKLVFAAAEIKQDICDLISDAPTIIPAEEGEA